ncbi:fibronectin type III domain-containing protein 4 isoform X2 [Patagioenas fasciata]|uniref:fibronectin type III domain-containing protein 4 isoform X2 n=1 Tax=Patagioenas fasciata TaxID=372321 RepID=UPI003A990CCD
MARFSAFLNPVLLLFSCDLCFVRANRPPSPVNVTVTQLKANSATVSWDVPEGDVVIGYAILQQRQDGQMQRFIREVNTTNRACVLWDLAEDADYIIQVQSIGLYGESQASKRVHFRTLKETDRLPSNSSNQGDITMEGLDKDRQLQTGEIIIIVAVLLMWAGQDKAKAWLRGFASAGPVSWCLLEALKPARLLADLKDCPPGCLDICLWPQNPEPWALSPCPGGFSHICVLSAQGDRPGHVQSGDRALLQTVRHHQGQRLQQQQGKDQAVLGAQHAGAAERGAAAQQEVALSQHNRGVSAAPAPCLGSWAACRSRSRPWKKRQHQAHSLELCMRRSAYQNLPLSRGRLSGDVHGAGSQPCMQRAALPVPHAWPRSCCCGARS